MSNLRDREDPSNELAFERELSSKVNVINLAENTGERGRMVIKLRDLASQVLDSYDSYSSKNKINIINKKDVEHISIQVDLFPRADPPYDSINVINAYGEKTYMDAMKLANMCVEKSGEDFYVVKRRFDDQPKYFS